MHGSLCFTRLCCVGFYWFGPRFSFSASQIVAFSLLFSVHMGVGSGAYVTYIHLRNLAPTSEYLPHSIYTFQGH